jgi:flagellar basal body-associated protein FliL
MLAKIIASQPAEPGIAQLMIRLRGEQAILPDLTFTLCNNEQNYLQPDASWSPAPHWFTINGGYQLDTGSGFRIGSTLLDPLLANASQVQIQVKLVSGEIRSTTLQLARDELLSSEARGQTGNYSGSSVLSAPQSEPVMVPPDVVETEPTPLPAMSAQAERKPKPGSPRIAMIVVALLVLLIVAGALWWFLGRGAATNIPAKVDKQPEVTAAAASPATAANKPTTGECSPANLNSQSELDFVQNCVQQKLDSNKLLAIIQAAKEAKKCGVAQRLYANRAQGGDSQVALAYANEYDPKFHKPSECFKNPDADTAAYWYETALQSDPNNQKAKQRLEELKK